MTDAVQMLTSLQNPRVKQVVKLRDRGAREINRALDNHWPLQTLFYCPVLFMAKDGPPPLQRAAAVGTELIECSESVFKKIAYRDRPDGLLAIAAQVHRKLADLRLPPNPLVVVAEAIEKPGNLGTILRSADAAGVHAVIVCDGCTDIHNPNVVRASIGTLFSIPVVEATGDETLAWLNVQNIATLASTPHAESEYTETDLTHGIAIIVGQEQT